MKYRIVVDKQPMENPSNEKRVYEVDIEELRKKGDICDTLVITKDESYVDRRLSLSEYHVLSVLEEPIKEPLEKIDMQLFEGQNYIYVEGMTGNYMYVEYLVKNEFTDLFATKRDVSSSIEQSADEINLQVSEKYVKNDEVIARINISPEEVKLKANKISLEGIVTANENFKILEDGSIEANNGKFTGDVYLGEGKKVIGGDGLMTNLQFKSTNNDSWLGYMPDDENTENNKTKLLIYANIPDNFKITSAKITLIHTPIIWGIEDKDTYGYCRNLKLYKVHNATQIYYLTAFGGWTFNNDSTGESEVDNAFGENGFTPTIPTNSNFKTEIKTSIDITNQLNKGINLFRVHTSDELKWELNDVRPYEQSGMCEAYLDVIGYMNI